MKNRHLIYFAAFAALSIAASCDDEVMEPDLGGTGNDSTIVGDSTQVGDMDLMPLDSLREMFTSFYPNWNYGPLCELSSDNIVDNNSVNHPATGRDGELVNYSLPEYDDWHNAAFAFEPATGAIGNDTPDFIVTQAYNSLELLNQFIYQVDNLPSDTVTMADAMELLSMHGEALVLRAYTHFILSNIFAPAYNDYGKDLTGIECVTVPGQKTRMTVAETYDMIAGDLENGIEEMRQYGFPQSVWRFNEKAAYAFAARFFLFYQDYDKCVDYATLALGSDPAAAMRDWRKFDNITTGDEAEAIWHNESEPSVFMMFDTYSMMMRFMAGGYRYAFNASAMDGTFSFSPICTLSLPPYLMSAGLYMNGEQAYGIVSTKVYEHFELVDSVAMVGYPMITRNEFTAEETLLCRAEANLMLGRTDDAFADMDIWGLSKQDVTITNFGEEEEASTYYYDLSMEGIKSFYIASDDIFPVAAWCSVNYDNTVYSDMLSNYGTTGMPALDEDGLYLLRYILHSRRLETVHDGMRFFDLKRFNIDYKHWIGSSDGLTPARVEVLTYDDPRRALTMPDLSAEDEATDSVSPKSLRSPQGMRPTLPLPASMVDRVNAAGAMD